MSTIKQTVLASASRLELPPDDVAARALAYANGMFTDRGFVPYANALMEQIGCRPNVLYQSDKDIGRIRVLVSFQSGGGDWGLNRDGLDHVFEAQNSERITAGLVVLTSDYRNVVYVDWIVPVVEAFKTAPLRNGKFGPYYWSGPDLRPAKARNVAPVIIDPDAAF
jgi:hypothetical protein